MQQHAIFLHLNKLLNIIQLIKVNPKTTWFQNLFRAQESMCFIMTLNCFSSIRVYISKPLTEHEWPCAISLPSNIFSSTLPLFQVSPGMDLFATCLGKKILSHILNLTVIRKFPNMPLVFISVMLCFHDFKQYFCAHFLSFKPIFFLLVIPRLFLRYHVVDVSTFLLGITDELLISRLFKSFAISSLILNILCYAVIFFSFCPFSIFIANSVGKWLTSKQCFREVSQKQIWVSCCKNIKTDIIEGLQFPLSSILTSSTFFHISPPASYFLKLSLMRGATNKQTNEKSNIDAFQPQVSSS